MLTHPVDRALLSLADTLVPARQAESAVWRGWHVPKRRQGAFRMIVIAAMLPGVVACSNQRLVARAWLRDSSTPRFHHMLANEIHSFWPVVPEKMDEAIEALMGRGSVPVSPDDAARFLALTPTVEPGKSLFLIRGIDVVTKPIPIRVFESKGVIDVEAGTFYTCFLIQPGVRAQPLVVALSEPPSRIMVGYTCDGL